MLVARKFLNLLIFSEEGHPNIRIEPTLMLIKSLNRFLGMDGHSSQIHTVTSGHPEAAPTPAATPHGPGRKRALDDDEGPPPAKMCGAGRGSGKNPGNLWGWMKMGFYDDKRSHLARHTAQKGATPASSISPQRSSRRINEGSSFFSIF